MFSRTIVVALVALPFVAQTAFAACTRSYTIKAGETCDDISAAQNVSTYQLAVVNSQINPECTNLVPGQTLCLGTVASEDCTQTYVVKAADDCDNIASTVGLNTTMMSLNNPQINEGCTNIYIGEVLCTAKTVMVPPAPAGPAPAQTIPATATPANAPVPATTTIASSAVPTSTAAATNEDDDQLPWCDEL